MWRRLPPALTLFALSAGCAANGAGETPGTTAAATASSGGLDDGRDAGSSAAPTADTDGADTGSTSTSTTSTDTAGGDALTESSAGESADDSSTGGSMTACADRWPMWNDGTDCAEAAIQVHQVSDDTVVLRQSLCTNFEGPFIYMFFGSERVLVEDSGAGNIMIASTIASVIDAWLAANGKDSIEIVVVNSHAHGDHVQGNSMLAALPNTTVVGTGVGNVAAFFGIDDWPTQIVQYDLGDRVLDIIPIPGHEPSHIAIYDHGERWLMTGDTLYPGRLYIGDFPTYVESIQRMVDHLAQRSVCNVMGTHIEMTNTPGVDFEFGADAHPDEHPLALTFDHLVELRDGVEAMAGNPTVEAHDDFIIFPL